ncbi:MAG TPA: hypothetical protein VGZ47_03925 [Gemmataceae bacterium]|jgi:hypothetical protein|nr:hypothetical protein [Gemmataceae bacterium]
MSDSYSIQQVGGAELAQHYPDRGVTPHSDSHKAFLTAGKRAGGWRQLFAKRERFLAVLSADNDGLRLLVNLDKFAVFIPWSEITASGERSTPGTVVRLQTAAVPALELEFHLDDAAADGLFEGHMTPLPKRDPPGRIYWPKPWALGMLVGLMLAAAAGLAVLKLPWLVQVAAVVVVAVAICIFWHVGRPIFEEKRPEPSSQREEAS